MSGELIAKLESASEGSRELDALVAVALDIRPEWLLESNGRLGVFRDRLVWMDHWVKRPSAGNPPIECEPFTDSIDAALALAERVLDDAFRLGLIQQPDGSWEAATLWTDEAEDRRVEYGAAPTPALAICAALLRASAAEGAGHE